MASPFVKSNRMKRMESRKSHSWWWDSHISPKNSKWLQENLEEMDQHVKRMLKLIEEDADSFAKKAELYFKKRPELVSLVEEFYRMYRSLAERYDHVTGELRKNLLSDIQSQSSGISDAGSEPILSTIPSPERRPPRTKSGPGPRPAGFDFFLGSGSDLNSKEGDDSSTLDSQSESRSDDEDDDNADDDEESSVNNYAPRSNGGDERRRISELENELREVKEKLNTQKEEIFEGLRKSHYENCEFQAKNRELEEEIARLRAELEKYKSFGSDNNGLSEEGFSHIHTLEKELSATQEKLRGSEGEVAKLKSEITEKGSVVQNLQDQLKSAQKEGPAWKSKLEREKREVSKLQDRIARYKTNLSERDQEIRGLKEAINNANKSLSEENEQLKEEMKRMTKERSYLEDNLKELDLRCQSLEVARAEIELALEARIEQLKEDILERENQVQELNERLTTIKDDLSAKIANLMTEISSKDDQMALMSRHLHELHMQHAALISEAEETRKTVEELKGKIKELEIEMDVKQEAIRQGEEEKREAIRQLCFSIEHYRTGYHELREAVFLHKRPVVQAI